MSRCLVTGYRGFIGSKVYDELTKADHEVLGIDVEDGAGKDVTLALSEGRDGSFHPHYWNFRPEYVFHLACNPRVGDSIDNPVSTTRNNILSTTVLLNFARKVGAKRVIYSGSSASYGNGDFPTNPYGLQKLVSEMECRLYSELYGLDCVTLKYFNVYSECQKADGPYATVIANWMESLRRKENPFITGDGTQERDMVHLSDIVSANIFAMDSDKDFGGKSYDVGTGMTISLNKIRDLAKKHFQNIEFEYREERPAEVRVTMADIGPLARLGWRHSMDPSDGIDKCFGDLKKEVSA